MSLANTVAKTIANLREAIAHHEHLYRDLLTPVITDAEFDAMQRRLDDLTRQYPEYAEAAKVGCDLTGERQSYPHHRPMLSLQNTTEFEDIPAFYQKTFQKVPGDFVCSLSVALSPKLDGMAVELQYEDGHLVRALSRGDGNVGEDVTSNVLVMKSVPLQLPTAVTIDIRGEVVVSSQYFTYWNANSERQRERTYATPRAMAVAAMRQSDSSVTARMNPVFIAYDFIDFRNEHKVDYRPGLGALQALGFQIVPFTSAYEAGDIKRVMREIELNRERSWYDTDGIVIRVNDALLTKLLGNTSHHPRYAIAYKYPSEEGSTTIEHIAFQLGRTGVVTPVLKVAPVMVKGTTIRSISLHNAELLNVYDFHIGDRVLVTLHKDISPQFVRILSTASANGGVIRMVAQCPSCNTPLVSYGASQMRCPNRAGCSVQSSVAITHFAGRAGLDIKGLGKGMIDVLINWGIVKDIADLVAVRSQDLERFLPKKAAVKLLNAIAVAKITTLPRFLSALGIDGIGFTAATQLARYFQQSLTDIMNASEEELMKAPGIDISRARSLKRYFTQHRDLVQRLLDHHVCWSINESNPPPLRSS